MKSFIAECHRRRIFQVAGLYIVGVWVVLQVAALGFDNWGIPTEAMRYVWIGAVAGLPIALILGWRFDIASGRIIRTGDSEQDSNRSLRRNDYLVLGATTIAALAITGGLIAGILQIRSTLPVNASIEDVNPKSIAVLPFADLSPSSDQAYFSRGIAEELLNLLAKFGDLKVTSRTSSFKLADAGLSVPEIAVQLNVAYILEGSLRKAGERIRITAQLIDTRSDTHVWSETYDRDLNDVFAIQDQISGQVTQQLKATLRGAERAADLTDAATYDLYLQGRRLLARRGPDDLTQAIELFERVTTMDPSFAPGHASLAQSYLWGGWGPDRLARAEASATRALELDPENSEAFAALGRTRVVQGDREEGRKLLEKAIRANPNDPLAYRWLGQSYRSSDPARSVALAQQAYLRDPLDPSIHWIQTHSLRVLGRTEEALAAARSRLAFDPDDPLAYPLAAMCHLTAGDLDLALKSFYLAYRTNPDNDNYIEILDTLGWLEELELAEAWMHEIERRFGNVGRAQAVVDFLRGDTEKALQRMIDRVERGIGTELGLAFFMLRATHDLERTRPVYEQGFERMGKDPTQFDPEIFWVNYIDYALILQRAGETKKASGLIRDISAYFDRQIAEGVMINVYLDHMQYLYAKLLATSGETDQAVSRLRQAIRDGYGCTECLGFPHFDNIRDEPGFIAARLEHKSKIAAQRQRLANEGMLLTPEEVMALENFSFDPFQLND
jgi:TolB-like protein